MVLFHGHGWCNWQQRLPKKLNVTMPTAPGPVHLLFILLFVMEAIDVLFGSSRLGVLHSLRWNCFSVLLRVEGLLMGRYVVFVLFGNLLLQPTVLFKQLRVSKCAFVSLYLLNSIGFCVRLLHVNFFKQSICYF